MTLKGDLTTFELPDLLSMIASSRRNGMLVVRRGTDEKTLCFSDGMLLYASSTDERERLGEVLVRERLLDRESVIKARKLQSATGKRLGNVLMGMGVITPDKLVLGIKAQAQEVITALFQWWGGSFEFIEGEYPFPSTVSVGFNLQVLIMEATKTVDDWARIKRILPEMTLFLGINPKLQAKAQNVILQRQEWEIVALVNGRRRIQDVCVISPYSDLETCDVLSKLVSRGLLLLKNTDDDLAEDSLFVAERSRFRPFIRIMNEMYYIVYEVIAGLGVAADKLMSDSLNELRTKHPVVLEGVSFIQGNIDTDLPLANLLLLDPEKRTHELTETLYVLLLYMLKRIKEHEPRLFAQASRSLKVVVRLMLRRQGGFLDTLKFRGHMEKLLSLGD